MSEQNADPAFWQIADPYIGSAEFLFIWKIKSFSLLSLFRLAGKLLDLFNDCDPNCRGGWWGSTVVTL